MSAALSRRAAIGVFATMPIAVAIASASAHAAHPSKWKEALARWRAADALWDSFLDNIYNPAIEELDRRALAPPPSFMVTAKTGATQIYFHDREVPDA